MERVYVETEEDDDSFSVKSSISSITMDEGVVADRLDLNAIIGSMAASSLNDGMDVRTDFQLNDISTFEQVDLRELQKVNYSEWTLSFSDKDVTGMTIRRQIPYRHSNQLLLDIRNYYYF